MSTRVGLGEERGESPRFEELKEGHDRLTSAFVEVHRAAAHTRLARPIVDGHLRRRTRTLHDAYLQAAETTFEGVSEQEWLSHEADALEKLESTFRWRWATDKLTGGVTSAFGFPGVAWLLSVTGVTAGLLSVFNSCLCHLLVAVPVFASFALYLTFYRGFFDKRKIFREASTGVEGGVYGAEDDVFGALGEEKTRERQFDVICWALITLMWALAVAITEIAIAHHNFQNHLHRLLWPYPLVAALITLGVYYGARKRKPV
jgi:hypothetical protein